jgi:hypothetical protein
LEFPQKAFSLLPAGLGVDEDEQRVGSRRLSYLQNKQLMSKFQNRMGVFQGVSMDIPFYALWVATPEMALGLFQGWLPTGQASCGRLTTPVDTPCRTPLKN